MTDAETTILHLRERIEMFVHERDWAQFHNPKDLAAAIAIEAGELMELFLWKSAAEVAAAVTQPDHERRLREELADIVILCCCLANRLDIDLSTAVHAKVDANAAKYPAHLSRGRADKYTRYQNE